MPKKSIILILALLVGASLYLSYRLDQGDNLPPEEVKKYAYTYLNEPPIGNFLVKIDTTSDAIVKKYPIRPDIFPSTIDLKGNIYFTQSIPGDQVFAFFPKREKFHRLVRSRGALLSKIFRYKDKLYVLTIEQKKAGLPRQSGLDIYDFKSKRYLKTIFFDNFGTSTERACNIDYKNGLFYTTTINLNSFIPGGSDDDGRTFLHIVDLNKNKRIAKYDLSQKTMWEGFLTRGNKEILIAKWHKRYVKKFNKADHRSAILSYSFANKTIEEKINFKDSREFIWRLYYDRPTNKLYLEIFNYYGFSGIRIIDCQTWKITKEIPFGIVSGLTKVADNKIYIEAIKKKNNYNTQGIYVLNTKTDTISKFIPGNFLGIAENAWYY